MTQPVTTAAPAATDEVMASDDAKRRLVLPAVAMLAVAIMVQVLLMPAIALGSSPPATPNLVIVVVVAIAVKRGVLAGALAGWVGGFATELLLPGRSLGVIAFAAVMVGAWCGRFAERDEPMTWWLFTTLAAASAGFVPIWYELVDMLRGAGLPMDVVIPRIGVPHLTFGAILAPFVWWVTRRLLGSAQVVEPGMMRR